MVINPAFFAHLFRDDDWRIRLVSDVSILWDYTVFSDIAREKKTIIILSLITAVFHLKNKQSVSERD